jgi:hypothetical protein
VRASPSHRRRRDSVSGSLPLACAYGSCLDVTSQGLGTDSHSATLGWHGGKRHSMGMNAVEPGDVVRARTADDQWVVLRATSAVTQGLDFPVVWVLDEERWAAAVSAGRAPSVEGTPWPAEYVVPEEGSE